MPLPIVFSHANGYPAGTYRTLFEAWRQAGHTVLALPMFGHDPRYPVASNWRPTRDQLIHFIETEAGAGPVHLVGHSFGGYLSLLVACRRPELAASVVLIDSPVLAGWRAHSVRVAKATRLIGRVSPARVSKSRRQHWASIDEVRRRYGSKHMFARWDPRVFDAYLEAGFEADENGVRLAFRREIETRIYNTLPHHFGALLHKHPPRCPVGFIGGTQSAEVRQVGLAATRAVTRGRMVWLEGSHLFPMERPDETAAAVLSLLPSTEPA